MLAVGPVTVGVPPVGVPPVGVPPIGVIATGEAPGAEMVLLEIRAEHTVRVPPPLAESLHWLIPTTRPEDRVPVAVHVSDAPPPLPEPLHCVITAPVVVAGKGLQAFTVPVVTEPTHWLTVTAVTVAVTPTKLFVTTTLHRSVPPPPLIEPLHCATAVTGWPREVVVFVQVAVGTPAEPVHSRTVTTADPPLGVMVLTTVTSQTAPPLPSALLHVVVGAMVTAAAGAAVPRDAGVIIAKATSPADRKRIGRRIATPVGVERRSQMAFSGEGARGAQVPLRTTRCQRDYRGDRAQRPSVAATAPQVPGG
jgi:hypothetical protein